MPLAHDDLVARLDPLLRVRRLGHATFPSDSASHLRILAAAYADTQGRIRLHGRPIIDERQAYRVAQKLYLQAQQIVEYNRLEQLSAALQGTNSTLTATILDVAYNDEQPADRMITYRVAAKTGETTHVFDGWLENDLPPATDRERLAYELRKISARLGVPIALRHPDEE